MSLNLGLESLGIVTDDVSLESVYAAEAEFSDAQISFERACFIVATEARNISNFNEIVSSLKRHSSQECIAFAQDLLGTASLEEIEKIPNTPEKVSLGGKMKNAWDAFVEWVKKAYNWIKTQVKKALAKLHVLTERGFAGEVKVHYTAEQLESFTSAVNTAIAGGKTRKPSIEAILNLKFLATKNPKTKIDLQKDGDKYFSKLMTAEENLVFLLRRFGTIGEMATTKSADGKKLTVTDENRNMINWYAMMMKRLKPFHKGILKDSNMFVNRVFHTAYGTAKDMIAVGKKGKEGRELDIEKVGKSVGGTKD